jgi:DNA replication protein DnaC
MRKLCSVKVLIIDGEEDGNSFRGNEFPTSGMTALDAAQRREMMELVEERQGRHALIITSQRPTEAWHEMIGDPTYADAILDRIIHAAHRVKLGGRSIRDKTGEDAA